MVNRDEGHAMTLNVLSFYTKQKLKIQDSSTLVTGVYFHILVEQDEKIRELVAFVPKRYSFKRTLNSPEYDQEKMKEYNVLFDFLTEARDRILPKWHISEGDLVELLLGLRLCLLSLSEKMPIWKNFLVVQLQLFKLRVFRLFRGFKK